MPDTPKNPAAQAMARTRWAKRTPEERSAYAQKMLRARWGRRRKKRGGKSDGKS